MPNALLTRTVGNSTLVNEVVDAIAQFSNAQRNLDALRRDPSATTADQDAAFKLLQQSEDNALSLIVTGNGRAAAQIRNARVERWTTLMDTWSRSSRVHRPNGSIPICP